MHPLATASLDFLRTHLDVGLCGTKEAAELTKMNLNSLKSRVARGHALVLRDPDGRVRDSLTFTGRHLIYNMVADRFLRFGVLTELQNGEPGYIVDEIVNMVERHVLAGMRNVDFVVRVDVDEDGSIRYNTELGEDFAQFTGDAAVFFPLGTMVHRIAYAVFARHGGEAFHAALKAPVT